MIFLFLGQNVSVLDVEKAEPSRDRSKSNDGILKGYSFTPGCQTWETKHIGLLPRIETLLVRVFCQESSTVSAEPWESLAKYQ